jgi:signal transduction histidine kinase
VTSAQPPPSVGSASVGSASVGSAPMASLPADAAEAWTRALVGTSYVSLDFAEITQLLRGLLGQLERVLGSAPFNPAAAQSVGASLVEAHFTQPRSLARTVAVLLGLSGRLGAPGAQLVARWHRVVAAVAEGYAAALRDHVLSEQQEMLDAALTAREQAEVALWASERRLEQTKDDFIATVSHELRTPLTPIKGYLQILLARGDSVDGDQRADIYRVMLSQADLVQHLLDDLLAAASGIGNSQFSITLEEADVARILKEAIAARDPMTERSFEWLGDDDVGMAVCDPGRLRQVAGNLLRNADLYAVEGSPVHVSAHGRERIVEVVVRDFGPGIPPELAETVFEPFRRLERGPTPGTGLGLHIARRLVEGMGGRIWLADEGPGASFHLTLSRP